MESFFFFVSDSQKSRAKALGGNFRPNWQKWSRVKNKEEPKADQHAVYACRYQWNGVAAFISYLHSITVHPRTHLELSLRRRGARLQPASVDSGSVPGSVYPRPYAGHFLRKCVCLRAAHMHFALYAHSVACTQRGTSCPSCVCVFVWDGGAGWANPRQCPARCQQGCTSQDGGLQHVGREYNAPGWWRGLHVDGPGTYTSFYFCGIYLVFIDHIFYTCLYEHAKTPNRNTVDTCTMWQLAVRGPFSLFDALREYGSKQRLRYKMNGFNLDMRYITPNIVAMASPADRGVLDSATRNHVVEVNRFFNTYHKGFVKYYNLVGELGKFVFDAHRLDATIVHDYAFLDHEIPGLSRMQAFCNNVKGWLQMDPQNIVCIMCRSGRNRTAVMACAYLLYAWPQEFQTASDALAYFTWCRMRTGEAVEIPSQRRYISYFSQRFAAEPQKLKMSRVFIPVGPLKQNKIRLDIHELRVSGDDKGNENEIRLLWTSKGKQVSGCVFGRRCGSRRKSGKRLSCLELGRLISDRTSHLK